MSRTQTILIVATASAIVVSIVGIRAYRKSTQPVVLTGSVLRMNPDPQKQAPIGNAKVSVVDGEPEELTTSDSSGLFHLKILPGLLRTRPVTIRFTHAEYKPLEITVGDRHLLYIARMEPVAREEPAKALDHAEPAEVVKIRDLRVRYSLKTQSTVSVGSVARQFSVVNTGNVPCKGQHPCSPDGKWKAAIGRISLDAGTGNEFRNIRASCIAGPCAFTRLTPADLSQPRKLLDIDALDWSDTASFLVEAEVTRTMITEAVRQSFPFIIGRTMSFALPGAAQGPSILADWNGEQIVFPLGPKLILTWATCTVEAAPGGSVYRCEAKPGYQLQQ
jgi:hypothetical protein